MAKLNIDFTKVEATSSPEPLATGWYRAIVVETEEKPTSNNANTGNTMIGAKFVLSDPAFKQRPLFKNFNLANQNQTAQDIGWGEMKALSEATGFPNGVDDTNQWHGRPVLIHVKLKPARSVPNDPMDVSKGMKEYDAQNDINGFKNIGDVSVDVISAPAVRTASGVAAVGEAWNPAFSQATAAFTPATISQPVQQQAMPAFMAPAEQAPVQQATPVMPTSTPAVAPAKPTYALTDKAQQAAAGLTMEQWLAADGWNLELMIREGYAVEVKPNPLPSAPAATGVPASPATIPTAAAATGSAAGLPWMQGK